MLELVRTKYVMLFESFTETRKSSCVNARGIPTAAYQVLHLLPEGGDIPPLQGTPLAMSDGGGYPRWGTPQQGYPLARSDGGTQGGVPLARCDGGYLRWGAPPAYEPGWGSPPCLDLARVPPPQVWTDKQSETITSRLVLRTRSVNMKEDLRNSLLSRAERLYVLTMVSVRQVGYGQLRKIFQFSKFHQISKIPKPNVFQDPLPTRLCSLQI